MLNIVYTVHTPRRRHPKKRYRPRVILERGLPPPPGISTPGGGLCTQIISQSYFFLFLFEMYPLLISQKKISWREDSPLGISTPGGGLCTPSVTWAKHNSAQQLLLLSKKQQKEERQNTFYICVHWQRQSRPILSI